MESGRYNPSDIQWTRTFGIYIVHSCVLQSCCHLCHWGNQVELLLQLEMASLFSALWHEIDTGLWQWESSEVWGVSMPLPGIRWQLCQCHGAVYMQQKTTYFYKWCLASNKLKWIVFFCALGNTIAVELLPLSQVPDCCSYGHFYCIAVSHTVLPTYMQTYIIIIL